MGGKRANASAVKSMSVFTGTAGKGGRCTGAVDSARLVELTWGDE